MAIAQGSYGMSTVQIQDLAVVTQKMNTVSSCRFDRQLAVYLEQVLSLMLSGIHHRYVQAMAGDKRPAVSSNPSCRFIHCTAPPAAPFAHCFEEPSNDQTLEV